MAKLHERGRSDMIPEQRIASKSRDGIEGAGKSEHKYQK
jgi:hypothetical protein